MAQQDKYYFINKSSAFRGLPDIELQWLLKQYIESPTVKELLKGYPKVNSKTFYDHLPYELTKKKCKNCGGPVYQKPERRATGGEKLLCISCKHNFTKNCTCESCKTQRDDTYEKEKAAYQEQAYEWLQEQQGVPYQPNEISLLEEIQLLLISQNYPFKYGFIDFENPINENYRKIPMEYKNFVSNLIRKKLIIPIGSASFDEDFEKDENGHYVFSLNLHDSWWKINVTSDHDTFLDNIRQREYSDKERQSLYREIYRNNLVQYFNDQVGFLKGLIMEDPIDAFLDDLTETYPLSKGYTIIHLTLNSCLHYLTSFGFDEEALNAHFSNALINNIEKYKDDPNLKKIEYANYETSDVRNHILLKTPKNQHSEYLTQETHFASLTV